jgi:putative phage-type endonuclease
VSKRFEFIAAPQRSAKWFKLRKTGITATDATVIAGLSPYKTPYQLWAEKSGKVKEAEVGAAAQRGIILEDAVATYYEAETGRKLKKSNGIVRVKEIPWAMASLDRTIIGERGLVEIKTSASRRWSLYPVPPEVEAQVQWQMFVTGAPWVDVVALLGGLVFRIERIKENIGFQTELCIKATEFRKALESGEPPALQGIDSETFAQVVPQASAEWLPADEEAERIAQSYEELRLEGKAIDEQLLEMAMILKEKIADKEGIAGADWVATWKQNKPSEKTDWKAIAQVLKGVAPETYDVALAQFTSENPGARVFRFKREGEGQ